MKKYFTKYLPIEGEIKESDMASDAIGNIYPIMSGQKDYLKHINSICKKVKLFLCSRDIQVGDKAQRYFKDKLCNPTEVLDIQEDKVKMDGGSFSPIWDDKNLFFKVIGEISSKASWIKEGDEFESSELLGLPFGGSSIRKRIEDIDKENFPLNHIWVKGPDGHFY